MNTNDFEHLNEMASDLKDDLQDLTGLTDADLNEYGEIEEIENIDHEDSTHITKVTEIALHDTLATPNSKGNSWMKRSYLAINETDKEFELFKIYCMYGGGRSLQYICNISNITTSVAYRISTKNNWKRRAEDYDRAELVKKMQQAQTSRHDIHLRKLETYRQEQEALGKQLTLNAARIALLANCTLSKMLDSERELDARDLPGMLNVAAKLADVGKNLQSSSLGVDNLLAALEEAEGEG